MGAAAGPLMLPGCGGGGGGGGVGMGGGGGGGGGGFGPPGAAPRYLPQDELDMEERMQQLSVMAKHPHPLVMEHPSLRQCVIFMAIVFVLALVALVVTAIYFGRTTQTSWNV
ncbi:uncharacterized protein LOC143300821 [Babylonia areolata]|uniref:uncharacterized protein LOC143300821 n=1 Tax=Babylonia areolata TaxID=304850 RepID=UPI003FD61272